MGVVEIGGELVNSKKRAFGAKMMLKATPARVEVRPKGVEGRIGPSRCPNSSRVGNEGEMGLSISPDRSGIRACMRATRALPVAREPDLVITKTKTRTSRRQRRLHDRTFGLRLLTLQTGSRR